MRSHVQQQAAIRALSQASSQDLNRAIKAYQQGDLSGAAELCRELLETTPAAAGAWHLLGLITFKEKDFERAERFLMRAVNLRPNSWSFHLNLGAVRAAAGRPHQALLAYRAAATLQPRSPDAHFNLGNALFDLGREAEAEAAYKRAVDLNPDDADFWAKLAFAQSRVHKAEAACRSAREALDLQSDHSGAREILASALVERCEIDAAETELRKLLSGDHQAPESADLLGRITLTRGDHDQGWRLRREGFEALAQAVGLTELWQPTAADAAAPQLWVEGSSDIAENISLTPLLGLAATEGTRIHLRCPRASHPALASLLPGIELHDEDEAPNTELPLTALTAIPDQLGLNGERMAQLLAPTTSSTIGTGGNIGICLDTQGNAALMARDLAPLIQLRELHFHALHPIGDGTPAAFDLQPADPQQDPRELIAAQDLIVGGDGVTARLAASMGKPVWLLCARFPDWVWGLDSETSPIYPNVRLFRQARCADWHAPVASLVSELRKLSSQSH